MWCPIPVWRRVEESVYHFYELLSLSSSLHLSTLTNQDIHCRHIIRLLRPNPLHLSKNLHTLLIKHPSKNNMFPIQTRLRRTRNKKLTCIPIRSGIRHAHHTRGIMLQDKIFILESAASVDASLASTVAVEEVTALDHESLDYAVETGVFVALWLALWILRFAGAELAEVFGSLWDDVFA